MTAPTFAVAAATTGVSASSMIEILVVYTQAVDFLVPDVPGLVALEVMEANETYANSGIAQSLSAVHFARVTYSEGGLDFTQHVTALRLPSDGKMDEVHALRDQHAADVVVLLVADAEACGEAATVDANAAYAFAAIWYSCDGDYVFAHEIGHLEGARHDRGTDPSNSPFQWGHGYVDPNGQWRTVMATVDDCPGCERVPYWSNPDVIYPETGQAMGTASWENNAAVLNSRRPAMAMFRNSLQATITGATYMGHTDSCTWTSNVARGTPPYSYSWWASWTTPSTGFNFTSGPSGPTATGSGYYYPTTPGNTTIKIYFSVFDSGGQWVSIERNVLFSSSPLGCYGS